MFIKSSCLFLSLSLALIPTIASAQFSNNEGGDVFKRAATGDTGGLLNILNQVQINGKANPNAASDQREQIKSATEDFQVVRMQALQKQVLEQRKQNAIVNPVVNPNK